MEDFPGWYILPGGKHEYDETPLQTAIRETFEETGIKVTNPKLRVLATHYHDYRDTVYLVYIFTAQEFKGSLIESSEGTPMWLPINQALSNPKLYPDLKRHIEIIIKGQSDELVFTYHRFNKDMKIIETK